MRIDPNYTFILTDKSWPLALPLIDDQGQPIGLAQYSHCHMYDRDGHTRTIFYTFNGKRFKLVKKVVPHEESIDDPGDD